MNAGFALLGFLNQRPNYGYDLKKMYDTYFGKDKPILAGQIYSTLSRLKRDEKVKETLNVDGSGGPDRVQYEITKQGEESLALWLETPEEPSPTLQTTLYVKTIVALLRGGNAASYLDSQRHAHIARMRQLTARRRDVSIAEKLLLDHAIFHIEADLRWIDLTISRLIKLKEELCL
jgi:DNA-binding PadR family transcriptional regulator